MTLIHRLTRRALIGLALAAGAAGAYAQTYPDRPLTLIVPWGAGGGTDAVARMIAALMEKDLGQPVNVVNRTGGSGVVGHAAIAASPADGYTIGMITVEIAMMHHQKLTELNPTSYAPIALVNLDPAGFQVRADSPYKDMKDVLAAIKAAPPGKFKARGPGRAASGTSRSPACCATRRSTPHRCPGCRATALRPACRIWSPAVSSSCRVRCPRRGR